MLRDKNIEWLEARILLRAEDFAKGPAVVGTGGAVTADVELDLTAGPNSGPRLESADTAANYVIPQASYGAGGPLYAEVNALGIAGFLMNTDGDELNYWGLIPYDADIGHQIRFAVWWTTDSATAADTIDWIVRYAVHDPDDTVALASPATVLDTVIAQDTVGVATAVTPRRTAFGRIDANTLGNTDSTWSIEVEKDTQAAGLTEDVWFLGLEIRYTPRRCYGPERNILGATRLTDDLGTLRHATQEGLA